MTSHGASIAHPRLTSAPPAAGLGGGWRGGDRYGRQEAIDALLKAGVDPQAKDSEGLTAETMAKK